MDSHEYDHTVREIAGSLKRIALALEETNRKAPDLSPEAAMVWEQREAEVERQRRDGRES